MIFIISISRRNIIRLSKLVDGIALPERCRTPCSRRKAPAAATRSFETDICMSKEDNYEQAMVFPTKETAGWRSARDRKPGQISFPRVQFKCFWSGRVIASISLGSNSWRRCTDISHTRSCTDPPKTVLNPNRRRHLGSEQDERRSMPRSGNRLQSARTSFVEQTRHRRTTRNSSCERRSDHVPKNSPGL